MSTEPDDVLIGAGIMSSANSLRSEFRVAVKSATRIRDDLMSRGIRGGLALSAIRAVDVRLCFRRFSSVLAAAFFSAVGSTLGAIWTDLDGVVEFLKIEADSR
jgi:hypothetical protein